MAKFELSSKSIAKLAKALQRGSRKSDFDFEKVFWNTFYLDGIFICGKLVYDLTNWIKGAKKALRTNWYDISWDEKLKFLTGEKRNISYFHPMTPYIGHLPPFTIPEVIDYLDHGWELASTQEEWNDMYSPEFVAWVKTPSDEGSTVDAKPFKDKILDTVFKTYFSELLLGVPAFFMFKEFRDYKRRE